MEIDKIDSAADHLERIKELAIAKWGDQLNSYRGVEWQRQIVKRYCELEEQFWENGEKAKVNQRRSQILRAFEAGRCTVDTLVLLYAAVDCRLTVIQETEL